MLPLRRSSHLTLSSILLTNVAAVSATSLVLEHHLGGLLAGLISTLLVVIVGEIVPQAILQKSAVLVQPAGAHSTRHDIYYLHNKQTTAKNA